MGSMTHIQEKKALENAFERTQMLKLVDKNFK